MFSRKRKRHCAYDLLTEAKVYRKTSRKCTEDLLKKNEAWKGICVRLEVHVLFLKQMCARRRFPKGSRGAQSICGGQGAP